MFESLLPTPAADIAIAALPGLVGVVALIMGGRPSSTAARWLVRAAGAVLILGAVLNGGLFAWTFADPDHPLVLDTLWNVVDMLLFILMLILLMVALGLTGRQRNASGRTGTAPPPAGGPGASVAGEPGWGGPGAPGGGYPAQGGGPPRP